jgi:hypothetical protein
MASNKEPQTLAGDYARVGLGYSCAFTLRGQSLECNWQPHIPTPATLRKIIDIGKYHESRHIFLTAMAKQLGGTVLCLEV